MPPSALPGDDDEITVVFKRSELNAIHRAIESGIVNLDATRGLMTRMEFSGMMVELRNRLMRAAYDRDRIPMKDRPPEAR